MNILLNCLIAVFFLFILLIFLLRKNFDIFFLSVFTLTFCIQIYEILYKTNKLLKIQKVLYSLNLVLVFFVSIYFIYYYLLTKKGIYKLNENIKEIRNLYKKR